MLLNNVRWQRISECEKDKISYALLRAPCLEDLEERDSIIHERVRNN